MFFPFCAPSAHGKCSSRDYADFYANCQKMRLQWLKVSRDRLQVHLAAVNAAIGELEGQIPAETDTSAETTV